MKFIQFFQMSTGYVPGTIPPVFDPAYARPIEATGDRGIIRVDARLRNEAITKIAVGTAIERGYVGYQVWEGASLLEARPVSGYWPVVHRPDRTAASASYLA